MYNAQTNTNVHIPIVCRLPDSVIQCLIVLMAKTKMVALEYHSIAQDFSDVQTDDVFYRVMSVMVNTTVQKVTMKAAFAH